MNSDHVEWRDFPLAFKLFIPILAINGCLAAILFGCVWRASLQQIESRLEDESAVLTHVVKSAIRSGMAVPEISELLARIAQDRRVNFIAISDMDTGTVLQASDEYTLNSPEVVIPFWPTYVDRQNLQTETGSNITPWVHPSKDQFQYISETFLARSSQGPKNFSVLIALDTQLARKSAKDGAKLITSTVMFVLTGLSFILIFFLRRHVIAPVQRIVEQTPRTTDELLTYRSLNLGRDEIGRLSSRIEQAYSKLGENFRRLDDYSKQLETTGRLAKVGSWQITITEDDSREWPLNVCSQCRTLYALPTIGELKSTHLIDAHSSSGAIILAGALQATVATGEFIDLELPLKGPNKSRRWVRIVGSATFSEGEVVSISGAIQDISNDTSLLKDSLETERKISKRLRAVSACTWQYTQASKMIELDQFPQGRIGDAKRLSFSFTRLLARVHPNDRKEFLEHFDCLSQGNDVRSVKIRIRTDAQSYGRCTLIGRAIGPRKDDAAESVAGICYFETKETSNSAKVADVNEEVANSK